MINVKIRNIAPTYQRFNQISFLNNQKISVTNITDSHQKT